MSEKIPGNLHVANDVLADIIGNAALECYGVVGMAAPNAVDAAAKLLPTSRLRRGISLESTENGVQADLYIIIEHGTNIKAVTKNLVDAVTFALKSNACVPVAGVNVHVQGIKAR